MPLSTEVFVMIIFICGLPFFYIIFKDSGLKGKGFFMLAYCSLALSNCFTVVEEFWLERLFNMGEHAFIAIGSILMLVALLKMTAARKSRRSLKQDHLGD
jgi:hypothetical protein